MPANSCTAPPYTNARAMAASAPGPQILALPILSANVVMANAASPNGAGSAVEYACGMAGSGPSATSSRLVKSDSGDMVHYLLEVDLEVLGALTSRTGDRTAGVPATLEPGRRHCGCSTRRRPSLTRRHVARPPAPPFV